MFVGPHFSSWLKISVWSGRSVSRECSSEETGVDRSGLCYGRLRAAVFLTALRKSDLDLPATYSDFRWVQILTASVSTRTKNWRPP